MTRTGDQKLMQELNRHVILHTIRKNGPISRSDIAKLLSISPTTVTSAVNDLLKDGYVIENGTGMSNGGRKPILVQFSPNHRFLIGVSIDNSRVTIAEMNLDAEVRRRVDLPSNGKTGDDIIAFVLDAIERFMQHYEDLTTCIGIAAIVPGIIDAKNGVIRYNAKLHLKDVRLKERMEERSGLTVWIDNDANAMALAELHFGSFQHHKNLIYITIGDGLGTGIVVNGAILRGTHGGAGEFGHTSIDRSGSLCDCGNAGCFENYVSWPAIFSRIVSAHARGKQSTIMDLANGDITQITINTFLRALEQQDELATGIMKEVAAYLGAGIVNLVNLFNPEVIILGGNLSHKNDAMLNQVREVVLTGAMEILTEGLLIQPASFGEEIHLKAAAALIMQDLFHFSMTS